MDFITEIASSYIHVDYLAIRCQFQPEGSGCPVSRVSLGGLYQKVGNSLMPCPRNNKNKTGNATQPAKTKRSSDKNHKTPKTADGLLETPPLPPASLPAEQDAWEMDEETVMYFLYRFQALEQALMKAGYTQSGRIPGSTRPDWSRFARHIQPRFNLDSSTVIQGAVAYMLWDEDNLAERNERIENGAPWANPDPHNDTVWLAELLQQTERKLIHALNFPGQPDCDLAMVSSALFIVDEWSRLDPEVEKQLNDGQ
jgi:hypothetical protein